MSCLHRFFLVSSHPSLCLVSASSTLRHPAVPEKAPTSALI